MYKKKWVAVFLSFQMKEKYLQYKFIRKVKNIYTGGRQKNAVI